MNEKDPYMMTCVEKIENLFGYRIMDVLGEKEMNLIDLFCPLRRKGSEFNGCYCRGKFSIFIKCTYHGWLLAGCLYDGRAIQDGSKKSYC